MNDWDNPLKKELPKSDDESLPETKSKDSDNSSIKRILPKQIRKRITIPPNMEELKVLAAQMEEMKQQFADQLWNQNELIQNQSHKLFNLRNHHPNPQNIRLSHAKNVIRQFIKSPIKMFNDKNPKKPNLAFDRSNYSDWEKAINRTLTHAFDCD